MCCRCLARGHPGYCVERQARTHEHTQQLLCHLVDLAKRNVEEGGGRREEVGAVLPHVHIVSIECIRDFEVHLAEAIEAHFDMLDALQMLMNDSLSYPARESALNHDRLHSHRALLSTVIDGIICRHPTYVLYLLLLLNVGFVVIAKGLIQSSESIASRHGRGGRYCLLDQPHEPVAIECHAV